MYTLPRPEFLTKFLPAGKENQRRKKKHLNLHIKLLSSNKRCSV